MHQVSLMACINAMMVAYLTERGQTMGLRDGRCLLVVNPAAKRGHGAEYGQHAMRVLREELGAVALDVEHTTQEGHAAKLAAEAGGYQSIVALGGDGVIHEVVNGLMQLPREKRPSLGVLPVGSGNDYARSLGISFKLDAAIRQLLEAQPRPLDVGSCNGEYFDETLSFGLDAAVALGTVGLRGKLHISGAPLYLASGINQMINHLDTYHFKALTDEGEQFEADMVMMAVQLGPTYGGGFHICPDASLDDGIFDMCWAAPVKLPRAAYLFLRAKNGGHVSSKEISFAKASGLHLEFDSQPPVQIDGEAHVASTFDIKMHPKAIDVLMP